MKEKIAIYGGAFNPPTLGHFHVIKEIFKNTDIQKIILTPDGFRLDKKYHIEEKHRNNMIKIFIQELKEKGFNIELNNYFLENKNNSDTTTMQVDLYFRKKLGFRPYHIFGTDILGEIKNWSGNPDKYIQKQLKKYFVSRPNYKFESKDLENYKLVNSLKNIDISSTKVRENISSNKNINKLVSEKIKKYIINNNLYK